MPRASRWAEPMKTPVVVDGEGGAVAPGGFRHADEAVRHKMLDALGDLALAGSPLLARYTGVRRRSTLLTNRLLRALFRDAGCDAGGGMHRPPPGTGRASAGHGA